MGAGCSIFFDQHRTRSAVRTRRPHPQPHTYAATVMHMHTGYVRMSFEHINSFEKNFDSRIQKHFVIMIKRFSLITHHDCFVPSSCDD